MLYETIFLFFKEQLGNTIFINGTSDFICNICTFFFIGLIFIIQLFVIKFIVVLVLNLLKKLW